MFNKLKKIISEKNALKNGLKNLAVAFYYITFI